MSALDTVGIGLAWLLMTTAAFTALSASALARSRHELEADPRGLELHPQGSSGEGFPAREPSQSVRLAGSPHAHGSRHAQARLRTHWPAIEMGPASPALRSSPSVARMHSASGRAEPIHLS
jgi:hypothetical protein